jgi:hypothetical protein
VPGALAQAALGPIPEVWAWYLAAMANQQLSRRQLCEYVLFEGIPAGPSPATCGAAKDDFVFGEVEA